MQKNTLVEKAGDRMNSPAHCKEENFAYVGTRTTGQYAGNYAIVGPGWQGSLPPGVHALAPSRTPTVLIYGRTLVDGPEDVEHVRALQKHYRLTPLSQWDQPGTQMPQDR